MSSSRLAAAAGLLVLSACSRKDTPDAVLSTDPDGIYFFVFPVDEGVTHPVVLANLGPDDAEIGAISIGGDAASRLALGGPELPLALPAGEVVDLSITVTDLEGLSALGWDGLADLVVEADAISDDRRAELAPLVVPILVDLPPGCDGDLDGHYAPTCGGEDCDDTDPTIFPDAPEVCDDLDNDCNGLVDDDPVDPTMWNADADGDRYGDPDAAIWTCRVPEGYVGNDADCDDSDEQINPAATEVCDGVDNDCDGRWDEPDAVDARDFYRDADSDYFGTPDDIFHGCRVPAGYTANSRDCDDSDPAINPWADEVCDGVDNDCDGAIDEDVGSPAVWYGDGDGDGYGDPAVTVLECEQPRGYVDNDLDCDDGDGAINPAAVEVCDGEDNDCDGAVDDGLGAPSTWYGDGDGDGYGDAGDSTEDCEQPPGYVADDTDCDDTDAEIYPGAREVCDFADNDCDGDVDEGVEPAEWYADADADGYGDSGTATDACEQPRGYVADDTDCDDGDDGVYPGADEVCNGVDDDCDGTADEDATDAATWYGDGDGDGYGDAANSAEVCDAPTGYLDNADDCDDTDPDINPAATEVCDGVDNDCDGDVDVDVTYWADGDGDGYGDPDTSTVVTDCTPPSGYVDNADDCDDGAAGVYPGATEQCDGVDEDCDGDIDEDAVDASTWYADADSDGYGDAGSTTAACTAPSGYVADDSDCDDGDGAINPGADEVCDGVDNDCDGDVDDDDADVDLSTASRWYPDDDGDGFGDDGSRGTVACDQPSGYVADRTDCDDADGDIYPGADEYCDGVDEDCDGVADNDAVDADDWYADADGDGYGDPDEATAACDEPSGYVDNDEDCDDDDADVNPDALDTCDTIDNDCSGVVDDGGYCPCGIEWDDDDNPYLFCEYNLSWNWGAYVCDVFDYHLVTIDDEDENDWLDTTADSYSTSEWFIGYNDISSEGTWVWDDGSSSTYTNWASGEPNNLGNEDCGEINWYTDGSWNDISCSDNLYFICEAF